MLDSAQGLKHACKAEHKNMKPCVLPCFVLLGECYICYISNVMLSSIMDNYAWSKGKSGCVGNKSCITVSTKTSSYYRNFPRAFAWAFGWACGWACGRACGRAIGWWSKLAFAFGYLTEKGQKWVAGLGNKGLQWQLDLVTAKMNLMSTADIHPPDYQPCQL